MRNSSKPAVLVRDLYVVRGRREVLKSVGFEIQPGIVTGLLGPSGSGKSTLMRSIVGVQIIRSGEVRVLGQAAGSAGLRRRVGYVTQAPSVYGDLSIRENLRYFAAVLGAPRSDVDRVIHDVALNDHADALVARLSGGQGSRVSLAVALLGTPELVVLDEPTVGLDPVLRRDLWATFHGLARRGVTVVVSSHVMDEAARCERLVLLRAGEVLADDTPAALLERTGAKDMDSAFLALCDEAEAAA